MAKKPVLYTFEELPARTVLVPKSRCTKNAVQACQNHSVNSRCTLLFIINGNQTLYFINRSCSFTSRRRRLIRLTLPSSLPLQAAHCPVDLYTSGHAPYCHGNFSTPMSLNRDKASKIRTIFSGIFLHNYVKIMSQDVFQNRNKTVF